MPKFAGIKKTPPVQTVAGIGFPMTASIWGQSSQPSSISNHRWFRYFKWQNKPRQGETWQGEEKLVRMASTSPC